MTGQFFTQQKSEDAPVSNQLHQRCGKLETWTWLPETTENQNPCDKLTPFNYVKSENLNHSYKPKVF